MQTKKDHERCLTLHTDNVKEGEKLSNYHAVCMELERARSNYGQEYSDSLVRRFNLIRFGIKEIGPTDRMDTDDNVY
jgi:hypothetical protein